MRNRLFVAAFFLSCLVAAAPTKADTFSFSTGNPDGKIATLSRPASSGKLETETADDFVTTTPTVITNATFTGLLVGGATPANLATLRSNSITCSLSIRPSHRTVES